MPVMDGLTASKIIRADKHFNDLPIIALTAHASRQHEQECLAVGIDDFVSKPYKEKTLYEVIMKQYIIENKLSVLVVEDNEVNQEVIKDMTDELKLKCHIAATIEEAIQYFNTVKYHIIFMDLNLPDGNGFEATTIIRQKEQKNSLEETPIIALTASSNDEDKIKAKKAGMNGYMYKPFEIVELQDILMAHVLTKDIKKNDIDAASDKLHNFNEPASAINHVNANNTAKDKNSVPLKSIDNDKNDFNDNILDQAVLEKLQEKPKLFNRIRKTFLETSPDMLNKIESAIANDDYEEIEMSSHSLKSSSRFMAAMKLGDICAEIESKSRDKAPLDTIKPLLIKAKENSSQVFNVLNTFNE